MTDIQANALSNATQNASLANYPAIYEGFMAMGIAETDIVPRHNVFTFNAWKALGRVVRKGQHGVKVVTWIARGEKRDASGNVTKKGFRFPKRSTVFHISQVEPLPGAVQLPLPAANDYTADDADGESDGFEL